MHRQSAKLTGNAASEGQSFPGADRAHDTAAWLFSAVSKQIVPLNCVQRMPSQAISFGNCVPYMQETVEYDLSVSVSANVSPKM